MYEVHTTQTTTTKKVYLLGARHLLSKAPPLGDFAAAYSVGKFKSYHALQPSARHPSISSHIPLFDDMLAFLAHREGFLVGKQPTVLYRKPPFPTMCFGIPLAFH